MDNTLLVDLMADAWRVTRSPLYKIHVRETVKWAYRELTVTLGDHTAFASAYDANSQGEEGKFYVWSEKEVDDSLGDAATRFKETYGISNYGNWDGHNILNRSDQLQLGDENLENILAK